MSRPGAKLVLTVDLEEWYHSLEPDPSRYACLEPRARSSVLRLLEILERHSARATFFVLAEVAELDPALVREIFTAGHEIGSHGYSHDFLHHMTPEQFGLDLRRSLDILSGITGQPVLSYRAPYFSVTCRTEWAFSILAGQGLRFDSSVFPVYNPRYGIPQAPRLPFQPAPGLLEWPVSTFPSPLGNLPFAGGVYFRFLPWPILEWSFAQLHSRGEPLLAYIHPWEIDPGQPRYRSGSRFLDFRHYRFLEQTATKLDRLLGAYGSDSLAGAAVALPEAPLMKVPPCRMR